MGLDSSSSVESRVDQLMNRINDIGSVDSATDNTASIDSSSPNQSFKAMAAMMQNKMYADALMNSDDKDSSNNDFLGGLMGMNSNPQMMAAMLQSGMMDGNMPQAMMFNPMMAMQMPQQTMLPQTQALNPAAMMASQLNSSSSALMPVQGRISSEYGHRHHPISGHDHFHSGVDIAAARGTAIRMPWDGKVVYSGYVQGFGPNTVIVAHENQVQNDGKIVYSVFGHNDNVFVSKGQILKQGEILGTVGSEGNSTGPHLHWETRIAEPGLVGTEVFNKQISMTVNPMTFA